MSCIFCRIASGEIPSAKVVENERAVAFLDVRPLVRGHVLVVPRRHAARVAQMLPEDAAAVVGLAQEVVGRLEKAFGVQGATLAWNDGPPAGQEVPHTHLHVVPRHEGDGYGPIHALFGGPLSLRPGELDEMAMQLRG